MTRTTHTQQVIYVRDKVHELVEQRDKAGLTITDMVVKTGWAPATIRRFESGVSNPTVMQIVVYTHALGGDWQRLLNTDEVFR